MPVLLDRYEWLLQAQWQQAMNQIFVMELAIARALSGKGGDLPTYEDTLSDRTEGRRLPTWMREFARVNKLDIAEQ